jgi:hypothetical protein
MSKSHENISLFCKAGTIYTTVVSAVKEFCLVCGDAKRGTTQILVIGFKVGRPA